MSEGSDRRRGVWVAWHSDWSGVAVFASEVACLRHAVANSMQVAFVEYGADLRQAVNAQHRSRAQPKRKLPVNRQVDVAELPGTVAEPGAS
jgi:hypothetical protein